MALKVFDVSRMHRSESAHDSRTGDLKLHDDNHQHGVASAKNWWRISHQHRHARQCVGSGNDFLIGGNNDTSIGGAGNDTFVFNQGFGKETVADFNPNQDQLAFNHALFTQYTAAQVLSQTHDSSAGAVIVVDPHDTVTLTGVTVAQLQAAQTAHQNWLS
jgi:hypothetical protein